MSSPAPYRSVTRFKGRHLGFLGLLCVGWAATRVVIIGWEGTDPGYPAQVIAKRSAPYVSTVTEPGTTMREPDRYCCFLPVPMRPSKAAAARPDASRTTSGSFATQDMAGAIASIFGQTDISGQPSNIPGDALVKTTTTPSSPPPIRRRSLRAEAYGYSFWRRGNERSGLATGGQYGGSQSGLIATFSLQRDGDVEKAQNLALLVRAAVAHDDIDEREVALGIRWRPLAKLPLSVTAERRFQPNRKDAFAIYAAGGVSDVELPLKFRVDSFAQAGVVSGKQAGPFFDAFVRADRKVVQQGALQLHAGAGAWAGGQRDTARLDIGPSLRTDVQLSDTRVRINLDWRFRVAGDATPGNGPALTLSTGF